MRKADLETALTTVPDFTEARPELEQVPTPPTVAADLLWAAWEDGWIEGRRVLDLGCGTGVLAQGAVILGAASVVGVDIDKQAVRAARRALSDADREAVQVFAADLQDWHPEPVFDTVVMNPPFGAQRKGADRVFYDRAREAVEERGGTCWFLAQLRTERFLAAYARDLGADLERVGDWDYPIRARFEHHSDAVRTFHVGGYRMGWD